MMDSIIAVVGEHGILAAVLVALSSYHYWYAKAYAAERRQAQEDHKEERTEWRSDCRQVQERSTDVIKDNNEAIRGLTAVIAEMNRHGSA